MQSATSNAGRDVPPEGHVSRIRANWSVFEDGALAQRLQAEEIVTHLQGNRIRNHQIRDDFPRAVQEQTIEQQHVEQAAEFRRRQLREQEAHDLKVAQRVEEEQRRYELERDRAFMERLHRLEQNSARPHSRRPHPVVPQPTGTSTPPRTPPLPIMPDGDVPEHVLDDVLPHVRGGLRYNDEQYVVKLARPAVVTDEPVYANNKPEHYAVSANLSQLENETGAISKRSRQVLPASNLLIGATGLSQKDLVMSRRAEEQLEQERRDEELAKQLQEQLNMEESTDRKQELEEQDLEYAKLLQAREEARLQRAKERARLKKQLLKEQKQQESQDKQHLPVDSSSSYQAVPQGSQRSESRQSERHSRSQNKSFEEEVRPPARRPYMNREAIDLHQSEFSSTTAHTTSASSPSSQSSTTSADLADEEDEEEARQRQPEEPQYANVGPAAALALQHELRNPTSAGIQGTVHTHGHSPVPPYMPMQQPTSRRSTCLENRIKKKKEKEGCKQQ